MNSATNFLDEYISFLKEESSAQALENGWVEITLPWLDRHNDYIQLYLKEEGAGRYHITDAGETLEDLSLCGMELDSPKRQSILKKIIMAHGVQFENNELFVNCDRKSLPNKKHGLIQAVLSVNDMFYLSKTNVQSLFLEDVQIWLKENHIRSTKSLKLSGRSGMDHYFDFVIPASDSAPERIIKAVNSPNKNSIQSVLFSWLDTKITRDEDSRAFAFLNDSQEISVDVEDALRQYNIEPVLWSKNNEIIPLLAA